MITPAHEYIHFSLRVKRVKINKNLSERKLAEYFQISKSEIHRILVIANLPGLIRKQAVYYDIQKWVLIDWHNMKPGENKKKVGLLITKGKIRTRKQLRDYLE